MFAGVMDMEHWHSKVWLFSDIPKTDQVSFPLIFYFINDNSACKIEKTIDSITQINRLSSNPTKWSRRIVWVCLTIFCGWRLKS